MKKIIFKTLGALTLVWVFSSAAFAVPAAVKIALKNRGVDPQYMEAVWEKLNKPAQAQTVKGMSDSQIQKAQDEVKESHVAASPAAQAEIARHKVELEELKAALSALQGGASVALAAGSDSSPIERRIRMMNPGRYAEDFINAVLPKLHLEAKQSNINGIEKSYFRALFISMVEKTVVETNGAPYPLGEQIEGLYNHLKDEAMRRGVVNTDFYSMLEILTKIFPPNDKDYKDKVKNFQDNKREYLGEAVQFFVEVQAQKLESYISPFSIFLSKLEQETYATDMQDFLNQSVDFIDLSPIFIAIQNHPIQEKNPSEKDRLYLQISNTMDRMRKRAFVGRQEVKHLIDLKRLTIEISTSKEAHPAVEALVLYLVTFKRNVFNNLPKQFKATIFSYFGYFSDLARRYLAIMKVGSYRDPKEGKISKAEGDREAIGAMLNALIESGFDDTQIEQEAFLAQFLRRGDNDRRRAASPQHAASAAAHDTDTATAAHNTDIGRHSTEQGRENLRQASKNLLSKLKFVTPGDKK